MLRFMWMLLVATVLGAAGGCVPERVTWSPDGTKGAIMTDEGLAVCDATGKLSKVWVPGVHGVGWLPDSKGMVVVHDVYLKTWKELAAAFPAAAEAAKSHAAAVKAALLKCGRAEDVMEISKNLQLDSVNCALAIICVRDTETTAFQMVPVAVWKQMSETTVDTGAAQIYDYAGANAQSGGGAGQVIAYFLYPHAFFQVRVSPTGKAVAITKGRFNDAENTDGADTFVAAMDGSKLLMIPQCAFPDWTNDGKQLIYIRQSGKMDPARLGTIAFRVVENDAGVVFDDNVPANEEVLGATAYHAATRVRVAHGGIVYFAGNELSLPTTGAWRNQTLFWINPKTPAKINLLTKKWEDALDKAGDTIAFFEVSPDGKLISVPYKDGRVMVLDVVLGTAVFVQSKTMAEVNSLGLGMVPVWRTADELTFLRPRADEKGNEVVTYSMSQKKATVISALWIDSVRDWLGEK